MKITRHAYKRFFERTNFTAKQQSHSAKQAWKYGRKVAEFCDPFYSYLIDKQLSGDRTSVRIYDKNIYVFDNRHQRLITVYPVPERFVPVKQFLAKGKQKTRCLILVRDETLGEYFISENGEEPTKFKSIQAANNYIKNNSNLDDKEVVVIPIVA